MSELIDKYTIEVRVPALGKTLEFMVPSNMETAAAKKLMVEMIFDPSLNVPQNETNLWLVDLEDQKRIPEKATCLEAGIKNGSRLMLLWIN